MSIKFYDESFTVNRVIHNTQKYVKLTVFKLHYQKCLCTAQRLLCLKTIPFINSRQSGSLLCLHLHGPMFKKTCWFCSVSLACYLVFFAFSLPWVVCWLDFIRKWLIIPCFPAWNDFTCGRASPHSQLVLFRDLGLPNTGPVDILDLWPFTSFWTFFKTSNNQVFDKGHRHADMCRCATLVPVRSRCVHFAFNSL